MDFGEPRRQSFTSFIFGLLILSLICRATYAAAPVAVDDVRTIPVGSVLTLNVLTNDFDSDGDEIQIIALGQPQSGTTALSGNPGTIIYTPAADFIGTDSFTYQIQEQIVGGLTATATVTVNVRESGFIAGLAITSNMRNLAQAIERACAHSRTLSDAELGETGLLLLQRCDDLEQIAQQNPGSIQAVLEQIGPDEALSQARVTASDTRIQTQAVAKRIEQRKMIGPGTIAKHDLSVNGLAVAGNGSSTRGGGASADEGGLYSPLGFFASVQLEEAEYDKNYFETGYEASNQSITVGADYYLNSQWLIGAALGYSTQEVTYNNEDGNLDVSSLTFLAFTSYQYGMFSFDFQAGVTGGELDMGRRIHYSSAGISLDQVLTSNTDSTQFLVHGQAQWEWHSGARSIYPFISLDFKTTEIGAFGEVGSSGWEMDVREQSEEQVTVALGVQSAWALKARWGVLLPTVSFSALSDSLSQRTIMFGKLAYDSLPDNDYFFDGQETETLYYELSLGASALFKHGVSAFIEYRHTLDYEFYETFQFQFGFRQAF